MFFSSHHFLSVHLSKRLNRRWVDLRFAGLFILLRGLVFWTEKAFSDHLFGNIFYIHTGALQIEQSEESDQGKYECVATNSAGTRYSAPANLYVRGRNDITLASLLHAGSGGVGTPAAPVLLCQYLKSWYANIYSSWSILVNRELTSVNISFKNFDHFQIRFILRLEVCKYLCILTSWFLFLLHWTVLGICLRFSPSFSVAVSLLFPFSTLK